MSQDKNFVPHATLIQEGKGETNVTSRHVIKMAAFGRCLLTLGLRWLRIPLLWTNSYMVVAFLFATRACDSKVSLLAGYFKCCLGSVVPSSPIAEAMMN